MTDVIALPCVDITDRAEVEERPAAIAAGRTWARAGRPFGRRLSAA